MVDFLQVPFHGLDRRRYTDLFNRQPKQERRIALRFASIGDCVNVAGLVDDGYSHFATRAIPGSDASFGRIDNSQFPYQILY